MNAIAHIRRAQAFVHALTGMELDQVQFNREAVISFKLPDSENVRHVLRCIGGALKAEPVYQRSALLGRETWAWHFTDDRKLMVVHFMSDRGRVAKNYIRLTDGGESTGRYGPAN